MEKSFINIITMWPSPLIILSTIITTMTMTTNGQCLLPSQYLKILQPYWIMRLFLYRNTLRSQKIDIQYTNMINWSLTRNMVILKTASPGYTVGTNRSWPCRVAGLMGRSWWEQFLWPFILTYFSVLHHRAGNKWTTNTTQQIWHW